MRLLITGSLQVQSYHPDIYEHSKEQIFVYLRTQNLRLSLKPEIQPCEPNLNTHLKISPGVSAI